MNNSEITAVIRRAYGLLVAAASKLQSPLLLVIRLYWGWSFFQTGLAKLKDHDTFAARFAEWHIPLPSLNVWLAGSTECIGGLLLLVGFASRLTCIPLIFTMIVAYLTAESDNLKLIFSDPDKFTDASPFLFLYAALIVLVFGPGVFSVDYLIARFRGGKSVSAPRTVLR